MKDTVFLKCDGYCNQYMRVNSLKVVKDKLEGRFSCYICGANAIHQVKGNIGNTKNYWVLDDKEEQISLIKDYEFEKVKCPNCGTMSDSKELREAIIWGACMFYMLHTKKYVNITYDCLHCKTLMDLFFYCDEDFQKGRFDSNKTKKWRDIDGETSKFWLDINDFFNIE